jgi:beta-phosphoglucomutase
MTHAPLLAAVFDLDGTLVDNMAFHARAWVVLMARFGVELAPGRIEREFAGRRNQDILPALLGRMVPPEELDQLMAEKERLYQQLYAPELALVPGASAFLDRMRSAGRPMALATASPKAARDFVLDGLGIRSAFERIVGNEDVLRGKPFPDMFLAAAKALGVSPAACVAFEDAASGIVSAKAAGMCVTGLTTAASAEALRDAGADFTMRDFSLLPQEIERRLFSERS